MLTAGATLSVNGDGTGEDVVVLPAASRAIAVNVCVPGSRCAGVSRRSNMDLVGVLRAEVGTIQPELNSETPTLSVAFAETVIVPVTVRAGGRRCDAHGRYGESRRSPSPRAK